MRARLLLHPRLLTALLALLLLGIGVVGERLNDERAALAQRSAVQNRLVEVRVGDKALDENTTYSVAISQYLVNGGDGYEMFRGARYLSTPEPGRDEASAFIKYIESLQSLDVQPDHRITPVTLAP